MTAPWDWRRVRWFVFALAIVLRVVLACWLPTSLLRAPKHDPDHYAHFAHHLLVDGVFSPVESRPSAHRAPFYPIVIAPYCLGPVPIGSAIFTLHLLFTLILIEAVATWSGRWGAGRWQCLAGLLVAVDPLLASQSTLLMSETLFVVLFLGCLMRWLQPNASSSWLGRFGGDLGTGVLLAGAALTRPIAGPIWVSLGIVAMFRGRLWHWLRVSLLGLVIYSPWIIRNVISMHALILTTTHGGYTIWLAHNPVHHAEVVQGPHAIWPEASFQRWMQDNDARTADCNEVERDVLFFDLARDWMRRQPRAAWQTALHQWRMFWGLWPTAAGTTERWLLGSYFVGLFTMASIGLIRCLRRGDGGVEVLIVMLTTTFLHAIFWSNLRMRAPLEPLLAVLASLAFAPLQSSSISDPSHARSVEK